ncbi:MAG TPA: hypothetical protein VK638_50650 [Edaphobacter sp.]|nr:hypothetical protein [Edaphobacter sp.]
MKLAIRYRSYVGQAARRLALVVLAIFSGLMLSQPALASNITVASPVSGTSIASPIWIRAHNVGCNGLAPTVFGYSVDSSSTLVRGVTRYDIDAAKVGIGSGTHTIHFKSWTSNGVCPVVSTTFQVAGSGSSAGSGGSTGSAPSGSIPGNAIGSANLDGKGWAGEHDAGTPGSSRGSTVYPATTPLYDDAREFYMTYSAHGGQRWHVSFAKDASATHFVYDTYVYFKDPAQVANLELDMNQVMSNGATVIFGTQCSSYANRWQFTTTSGGGSHWHSSNIPCNPKTWAANTWHHVQIASHRSGGVVTYDWVNVDGKHSVFSGAVGTSALQLGWEHGDLLINFQLDGTNSGSGSITAYIHKMTIFRW